jgi:polar amino acid transport system substrate-binding protein
VVAGENISFILAFSTKMRAILFFFLLLPSVVIAAEPMRFVYYDDYRPRSWSDNGRMRGILVDIIDEAIGTRLGIPVAHSGYPWKRAQYMVKNGMADALVTLPTQERYSYTVVGEEPVIVFTLNIVTRRNHPKMKDLEYVTTIEQLKDYSIVDYLGNGWAKSNLKNMNIHWVSNIDSIFRFLSNGRADIAIASKFTIFIMHHQGYASQLRVLPNKLSSVSFHVCVGKHSVYIDRINDIDKVLREMRTDGTIDRIEMAYYR